MKKLIVVLMFLSLFGCGPCPNCPEKIAKPGEVELVEQTVDIDKDGKPIAPCPNGKCPNRPRSNK